MTSMEEMERWYIDEEILLQLLINTESGSVIFIRSTLGLSPIVSRVHNKIFSQAYCMKHYIVITIIYLLGDNYRAE
jgi:hypothetical protein